MEAKDRVMDVQQVKAALKKRGYDIPAILGIWGRIALEEQDEISFKAGRESMLREVVEWLKHWQQKPEQFDQQRTQIFTGDIVIRNEEWQAQLEKLIDEQG